MQVQAHLCAVWIAAPGSVESEVTMAAGVWRRVGCSRGAKHLRASVGGVTQPH